MKRILIVEDNQEHWEALKSWIHMKYKCYPSTLHEFNELSQSLNQLYSPGLDEAVFIEARNYLKKILRTVKPDLLIVDYELMEGNHNCNGVQFVKDFVTKKNVLIMTGVTTSKTNAINNKIRNFCEDGYGDNKLYQYNKEEFDLDYFRDKLMSFIQIKIFLETPAKSDEEDDDTYRIDNLR